MVSRKKIWYLVLSGGLSKEKLQPIAKAKVAQLPVVLWPKIVAKMTQIWPSRTPHWDTQALKEQLHHDHLPSSPLKTTEVNPIANHPFGIRLKTSWKTLSF